MRLPISLALTVLLLAFVVGILVRLGAPRTPEVGAQFHGTWTTYTDATRLETLDKLKAAGVTWLRVDLGWASAERNGKGEWNRRYLRVMDFSVEEAHRRGFKLLGVWWQTPHWASDGGGTADPPRDVSDYADAARWVAARYRGKVQAWEVWNEPNPNQAFWTGTVEEYVALLKAAYPAFKEGCPDCNVVLGGPDSQEFRWIERVYQLGARDSFDVMATHPYQGKADAPPEFPTDGNVWWLTSQPLVDKVMRKYGDREKPVWWTEFGWSVGPSPTKQTANWQRQVDEATQADYAHRAIGYARENYPNVKVAFWYKDRVPPADSWADAGFQNGYGLLRADGSVRPVLEALASG